MSSNYSDALITISNAYYENINEKNYLRIEGNVENHDQLIEQYGPFEEV